MIKLITLFTLGAFLLAFTPALAQEPLAEGADKAGGKPWNAGVLLEGSRSEIDIEISDLDAVDWQGNPITSPATGDPNDNAEYATQRTYSGIKGFFSFAPGGGFTVTGFLRLGQIREVFRCSFDEGSFFVDWGDRPETNVTAYVGSVLFGGGRPVP